MNFWYASGLWATLLKWLLAPLSALFWGISQLRRILLQRGLLTSYRPPLPVVVVGNLSVGGNGKTPVVIWLVQQLHRQGLKVGVISRGYGSRSAVYPRLVTAGDDPLQAGDEPLLIAQRTAFHINGIEGFADQMKGGGFIRPGVAHIKTDFVAHVGVQRLIFRQRAVMAVEYHIIGQFVGGFFRAEHLQAFFTEGAAGIEFLLYDIKFFVRRR